jgi:hypothetical protein
MPSKMGGEPARKIVNYAAGNKTQAGTETTVTVGDVYLDNEKVGRAIVRSALSGRN